jgi:hypothetical protein
MCPHCEPAIPGERCELGRRSYDVYVAAVNQEGRPSNPLKGAVAITAPLQRDLEPGVATLRESNRPPSADPNHQRGSTGASAPSLQPTDEGASR